VLQSLALHLEILRERVQLLIVAYGISVDTCNRVRELEHVGLVLLVHIVVQNVHGGVRRA
tara:strand:- start:37 stop:216 length:180 start_codon:yes stop_codon:yes gene_type:complete